MLKERTNHCIVTGISPIADRLADFFVFLKIIHIIEHIPGTVHVKLTKMITVIPRTNPLCLILITGILQNLPYLLAGKSKIFIQS